MILPFLKKRETRIKPFVLVVLDGFGLAPASDGNAITKARTPNYNSFLADYPNTELVASGESVGLPANEVGNTEVGHLILGAGRIILQDLKKIDTAIKKGYFYDNRAFLGAAAHVKERNSSMHIMGLVGSGRVHSSLNHLYALLQFCKKEDIRKVFLHLFTDGRDSPPKEGIEIIRQIENRLSEMKVGKIASISGRYYAMDRDRRWERTEKVYKAIVQEHAIQVYSAEDAVNSAYARGQTDEFIEPTIIADDKGPIAKVNDGDSVIFFNFRIDRPKQLAMAFVLPNFESIKFFDFGYDPATNLSLGKIQVDSTFERGKVLSGVFFVTMTEYHKDLPVSAIGFGPESIENPMSIILSDNGLRQAHMSESEKERFVRYYFNGLREDPVDGEEDVIVPSPKVATYDKKPQMSLPRLVKEFKWLLKRDLYHFFIINFANPDMVAHSGNIKATIRAIEYVDKYLGILVNLVLDANGTVLVTADHGNAEELLTFPAAAYFYTTAKGSLNTDHSNNPVPLIVIRRIYKGKTVKVLQGGLADVAPTILALLDIDKPVQMTGNNLIKS